MYLNADKGVLDAPFRVRQAILSRTAALIAGIAGKAHPKVRDPQQTDHLRKVTLPRARFALYNTEEFHRLKESLARLPLEKIELFIDPQYENNSETDK